GHIKIKDPCFIPKTGDGIFSKLSYYSIYFNCKEINSTYYQYAHPGTALEWLKSGEKDDFSLL
ncbi:MAG: DUF72 domain-containing protein, partial [Ignavibacteriales bacterium]|nr:DUF72 domain-containing protein [Ignavibacteriales bacterium]